ncbi:hypothetical protein IWZ00DRAFT_496055, partial [Phyllosticta capitalensis]
MAPASVAMAPVRFLQAVLLLIVALSAVAVADSTTDTTTLTLLAWPLGKEAQSRPLAKLSYNAANASAALLSWTPPTSPSDLSSLVRVGLSPKSSSSSSSILTSAAALSPYYKKTLVLHAASHDAADIFTVGLGAVPRTNEAEDEVDVRVERVKKGPAPVLNKPVVLDESGKVAGQEEPQKTFLQKWVICRFQRLFCLTVANMHLTGIGGPLRCSWFSRLSRAEERSRTCRPDVMVILERIYPERESCREEISTKRKRLHAKMQRILQAGDLDTVGYKRNGNFGVVCSNAPWSCVLRIRHLV